MRSYAFIREPEQMANYYPVLRFPTDQTPTLYFTRLAPEELRLSLEFSEHNPASLLDDMS